LLNDDKSISFHDRGFKYILNYRDHFSKFLVLKPMKCKTAAVIIDIFCWMTPPAMLQSDNGRQFTASIIMMWPRMNVVILDLQGIQSPRGALRGQTAI
jgi:hypothetical protein